MKQPQCVNCFHFINDKKFGCKAFSLIPDEILTNKIKHNRKIDGQIGNYLFKEKPEQ